MTPEEFADKYTMSVEAARSTLAAYAADPGDEQWSFIAQESLDIGAMEDLAVGAEIIISMAGAEITKEEMEEMNRNVERSQTQEGAPWDVYPYTMAEDMTKLQEMELAKSVVVMDDAYGISGQSEFYYSLVDFSKINAEREEVDNIPYLGIAALVWSFISGTSTFTSMLLAIGALITGGILGTQMSETHAMYIGKRLAGLVSGKVEENTARGFGMKRLTYKSASGEGHQVKIVR